MAVTVFLSVGFGRTAGNVSRCSSSSGDVDAVSLLCLFSRFNTHGLTGEFRARVAGDFSLDGNLLGLESLVVAARTQAIFGNGGVVS